MATISANGTPSSTGEALLREGLSHPLPGACTTFLKAFEKARQPSVPMATVHLAAAWVHGCTGLSQMERTSLSNTATSSLITWHHMVKLSPPTSDTLAAWDCRGHLKHILCLLCVASHITLLTQYHAGGSPCWLTITLCWSFPWDTLSQRTTSKACHEIMAPIATTPSLGGWQRTSEHLGVGGIKSCICALRWLEGGVCGRGYIPRSHPVLSSAFETPTISPTHQAASGRVPPSR